jgi:hypothetical protein
MISAGFFEILGVSPVMGRTFTADEDRLGANPTAMITEGLWQRKFGGRKDIIGQRIILDDVGRTIIGVIPSSFHLRIQNFQRGGPTDPLTFISVAALLCAIAMLACYVPAHRAMKVDPMEALRHQ